jgi:hypothetical protein
MTIHPSDAAFWIPRQHARMRDVPSVCEPMRYAPRVVLLESQSAGKVVDRQILGEFCSRQRDHLDAAVVSIEVLLPVHEKI